MTISRGNVQKDIRTGKPTVRIRSEDLFWEIDGHTPQEVIDLLSNYVDWKHAYINIETDEYAGSSLYIAGYRDPTEDELLEYEKRKAKEDERKKKEKAKKDEARKERQAKDALKALKLAQKHFPEKFKDDV